MTFPPHQQVWSCNKYHDFSSCLDELPTSFKLNNASIALWTNSTSSYSFIRTVRVAPLQKYVRATFSKVFSPSVSRLLCDLCCLTGKSRLSAVPSLGLSQQMDNEFVRGEDDGCVGDLSEQLWNESSVKRCITFLHPNQPPGLEEISILAAFFTQPRPNDLCGEQGLNSKDFRYLVL